MATTLYPVTLRETDLFYLLLAISPTFPWQLALLQPLPWRLSLVPSQYLPETVVYEREREW